MYDQPISADVRELLRRAYAAFNARDIEAVLSMKHPDVEWPNGMEGGYVYGHDGVRAYWTRQWRLIDPFVEPQAFSSEPDGRVLVEVHQRVLDKDGGTLLEGRVQHIYSIRDRSRPAHGNTRSQRGRWVPSSMILGTPKNAPSRSLGE